MAIKLIRPGMDNAAVMSRFNVERQTLARLSHPGIASVFAAGETETGAPYFAMEYVPGKSIDTYCEEHALSIDQRIDLLVLACQAVQHAHARGVLHRDIKPSNVLAFKRDQVDDLKIIDFGISKALHGDDGPRGEFLEKVDTTAPCITTLDREMARPPSDTNPTSETLTLQGQLIGTLEYMSPEQAAMDSQQLDIRTDIYSLGALLYKLIAGKPPIDRNALLADGYLNIADRLRDLNVPAPGDLVPLPSDELDWITLKALSKDRERRYATVHDLQNDLQRYRRGEAVSAYPHSIGYRMRVLWRRQRVAVLLISFLAASILFGAIGSLWGWRNAEQSRALAKGETRRANQLNVRLNQSLYLSQISGAAAKLSIQDSLGAGALLDQCHRQDRGLEWRLIAHQMRDNIQSLRPAGEMPLSGLDVSPDGEAIAGVRNDGKVEIIDVNGQTLGVFDDERHFVSVVRWIDQGRLLLGDASGHLVIIDTRGQVLVDTRNDARWPGRTRVYDIAMADESQFYICCGDSRVFRCQFNGEVSTDVDAAPPVECLQTWMMGVRMRQLAYNAGQNCVLGCSTRGELWLFQSTQPRGVPLPSREEYIEGVDWLDDEHFAVIQSGAVRRVRLRIAMDPRRSDTPADRVPPAANFSKEFPDTTLPRKNARFPAPVTLQTTMAGENLRSVASLSPRQWIVGSGDGTITVYDVVNDRIVPHTLSRLGSAIRDLRVHADAMRLWVACADGAVHVYDLGKTHSGFPERFFPKGVSFVQVHSGSREPERSGLLTVNRSGELQPCDAQLRDAGATVQVHLAAAWGVVWHNNRIYSIGDDQLLRSWSFDSVDTHCTPRWVVNTGWGCRGLAVAPSGEWIASATPRAQRQREGTVAIYSRSGEFLRALKGHDNWVLTMAVVDENTLITSGENKTIRRWDVSTGEQIWTIESPTSSAAEILHVENAILYSGHRDGSVNAWRIDDGKLLDTFNVFGDAITGVGCAENRILVSCESQSSIRVLDRTTGAPIVTVPIIGNASGTLEPNRIASRSGIAKMIVDRRGKRIVLWNTRNVQVLPL
ncbi:MAG: WD40 repeat domain-containing serine/threonine-protein kinase [Planctomycetota bacterium]